MKKKYFDRDVLLSYTKEKIADIAEEKCSSLTESVGELSELLFDEVERREDADKALEFYGMPENWQARTENKSCYNRISRFDYEKKEYSCGDFYYQVGGKTAREYQEKYASKESK